MRFLPPLSVVLAVCACGASTPATDATTGDGPSATRGPDIPWLSDGRPPVAPRDARPCPDGWREVTTVDGDATCEAYPEDGPRECAPGEAHFPGEPGCAAIGVSCPSDPREFAEDLPADRPVTYVRAGETGGDGTRAAPWGGLGEFSLTGLTTGTVLALGPGTYAGEVRLPDGVSLWGSCVDRVTLTEPTASASAGVVTLLMGADAEVQNVRIADSGRPGVFAREADRSMHLEGVLIERATAAGIRLLSLAQITARSLVVRDTRSSSTGALGRAVMVEHAAEVSVERAVFERNRDHAVSAGGALDGVGARLELRDAAIRDTQVDLSVARFGRAVGVLAGATLDLERVVAEGGAGGAIHAGNAGTTLALRQVIVRGSGGRGVSVESGALATLSRAQIEGSTQVGLYVSGEGTTVGASDLLVRGIRPDATGELGLGVTAQAGATLRLDRTVVRRVANTGVVAASQSVAELSDVVVSDVVEDPVRTEAVGIEAQLGARATITRAVVERTPMLGIGAHYEGAEVELEDVLIRDIESDSLGLFGRGLNLHLAASMRGSRVLVESTREAAATANERSALELEDVILRDVRERGCVSTTCPDSGMGHGLGVYDHSRARVTRFEVRAVALCGLHVASFSELDAMDGTVADSTIGGCVQVDGYDLDRLGADVAYVDNGVSLDSAVLPIPDPLAPAPAEL